MPCFNHSELAFVNALAAEAGMQHRQLPFLSTETLSPDNGKRFFSECLKWHKEEKPKHDVNDLCLCSSCHPAAHSNEDLPTPPRVPTPPPPPPPQHQEEVQAANNQLNPTSNVPGTISQPVPRQQQQQQQRAFPPLVWHNPCALPPPGWAGGFCCMPHRLCCFRKDRRGCSPHDRRCPCRRKNKLTTVMFECHFHAVVVVIEGAVGAASVWALGGLGREWERRGRNPVWAFQCG